MAWNNSSTVRAWLVCRPAITLWLSASSALQRSAIRYLSRSSTSACDFCTSLSTGPWRGVRSPSTGSAGPLSRGGFGGPPDGAPPPGGGGWGGGGGGGGGPAHGR